MKSPDAMWKNAGCVHQLQFDSKKECSKVTRDLNQIYGGGGCSMGKKFKLLISMEWFINVILKKHVAIPNIFV